MPQSNTTCGSPLCGRLSSKAACLPIISDIPWLGLRPRFDGSGFAYAVALAAVIITVIEVLQVVQDTGEDGEEEDEAEDEEGG